MSSLCGLPAQVVDIDVKRRTGLLLGVLVIVVIALGFAIPEGLHLWQIRDYANMSPVCRVETSKKVIALTFDDGPDPFYTQEVLAELGRYGDKATFFVLGMHVELLPGLVRKEQDQGMEVGNHTWSHPHLPTLGVASLEQEVVGTQQVLAANDVRPDLFRAPYGEILSDQLAAVERLGLRPVHWSIPLDHYVGGLGLTPSQAASRMITDIQPGDIILAHDARLLPQDGGGDRELAMKALRLLLPALAREGFRVTTISNLLAMGNPVSAKPRTWFWQTGFGCPR